MIKISVITICYNAAKTIEETINSVIRQDYPELEYIIIDGGSTDGTTDVINKYQDKIAYFVSEPDKGISDAFNKGIKASTGEIIGIINSNDLYYKNALKTVSAFFEANPDTDVTFGNWLSFSNEEHLGRFKYSNSNLEDLRFTFEIAHPTVFVKRSAYEQYGIFNLDYKIAMDYDLLSRMYYSGASLCYIDKIISCFRWGGTSEVNYKRRDKEHKEIALRNGCSSYKIKCFLLKNRVKYLMVITLKRIGVFNWLRDKLKPVETYNVIWWEE